MDETTLANIAELSEVPLDNVYYYFKTKNEIVSEVIKLRQKSLLEALAKIEEKQATPDLQLKALIQQFLNMENKEQNLGAMIPSLWQELGRS